MAGGIPLASNPATAQQFGLQNIPMNASAGAGAEMGVTPEKLIQQLDVLLSQQDIKGNPAALSLLQNLFSNIQSQEYKNAIQQIIQNAESNIGAGPTTFNLDTGKRVKTPKELIEKLKRTVQDQMKMDKIIKPKQAQANPKKKKKTRGNPFRVLMGKVGKLLDHGLEKKEIVRYLVKLKFWPEETISKAVDIVKDYNKKNKRKHDESSDDDKEDKKAFNLNKFIKTSGKDVIEYDIEPDYAKRSTGELQARITWLESLNKFNPKEAHSEGREAADKEGIKGEIRKLKVELQKRGFEK